MLNARLVYILCSKCAYWASWGNQLALMFSITTNGAVVVKLVCLMFFSSSNLAHILHRSKVWLLKILGKPDGTNVFRSSQWRFRRPTCLNHFQPHDSTGHVTVLQSYTAKPLGFKQFGWLGHLKQGRLGTQVHSNVWKLSIGVLEQCWSTVVLWGWVKTQKVKVPAGIWNGTWKGKELPSESGCADCDGIWSRKKLPTELKKKQTNTGTKREALVKWQSGVLWASRCMEEAGWLFGSREGKHICS